MRDAPGKAVSRASALALLFLAASLMALALVPAYSDSEVRRLQAELQEVLAPAERTAGAVEAALVAQMAALEAFLATGEGQARLRYRAREEEEAQAFLELQDLVTAMPLDRRAGIQEILTRVITLSFEWHLGHRPVLNEEVPREAYVSALATERQLHQNLLTAMETLRDALARERDAGLVRMEAAREDQRILTRALAILGLAATLVVVFLGFQMRTVIRELVDRRQEALRARRDTDAIMEATGDGVLGMDLEGRCMFLNRAGAEHLRYPTRMVVGRDIHDLLHHSRPDGTPLPRGECIILRTLREGRALAGHGATLWRAGREPFPVQISLRPLKDGAVLKGAVLTFTDMTETRAAEASLRQALQARDEVLAVVSHDLRNPVGTIYSTASLLVELDLPRPKAQEHLKAVQRSAQRMNRLIQDLLDVARLEAGALRVAPGPLSAEELLLETGEALRPQAEDLGIDLRVVPLPEGMEGWGDRDRVLQILANLVENALKFTPMGGHVELGGCREDGGKPGILFWVRDTGPGISPEGQVRLFDRFWQVSRRDKRGAGLGLAIVKGLVEAHGGKIWVESREGEGSTFRFTLPDPPPR